MPTQPVIAPISQVYGANCAYYKQFKLLLRSGGSCHEGTDFAVPVGTPIRAVHSGTVRYAGLLGAYGNYIGLQAPEGYGTGYGHLSKLLVAPGQRVNEGDVIGLSGGAVGAYGSGNSSGPHLHFNFFREYGTWVYDSPDEILNGAGMGIPEDVYKKDVEGTAANWRKATNKALRFLAASEYRAGGLEPPASLDKFNDRDPDDIVKEIRGLPGYSPIRSDAQKRLDSIKKSLEVN